MIPRNWIGGTILLALSFITLAIINLTTNAMSQPSSFAKTNPDELLGKWVSEAQDSKMEIYQCGNAYCGRLLAGWGNTFYQKDGKTLKTDTKNPDSKVRNRPLFNMEFISDLTYEEGEYTGGKLYVTQLGRLVRCQLKFSQGRLVMRVYVGFPLLGTTKKWTRVG